MALYIAVTREHCVVCTLIKTFVFTCPLHSEAPCWSTFMTIVKTQGRLQKRMYWPGMRGDVKRDLATPLDLWMQPELEPPPEDVEVYKSELSAALRDAYDHVRQLLAASHETQKGHYDKRWRQVSFEV
ncbi:hypothetical protein ABVT39_026738 [Epinephelus coioides]